MSTAFRRVGEIETDERRRASLGKMIEPNTRYAVEANDEGVLRLVPLIPPMTKAEFDAALREAMKRTKKGKGIVVDDITEFLKDLDASE